MKKTPAAISRSTKIYKSVNLRAQSGMLVLTLPEDQDRAKVMLAANDLWLALWDFYANELHDKTDHGHSFKSPDEALGWARQRLYDIIEEAGLGGLI